MNARTTACIDGLTGLPLYGAGLQALQDSLREATDAGAAAAVTLFDVEALLPAGDDERLVDAARVAELMFAGDGVVFRRADESFCAVSFGAGERAACARAEALRRRLKTRHTNVTLGVALSPTHGTSVRDLVRAAEDAVRRGKRAGGRRVVLARAGGVM